MLVRIGVCALATLFIACSGGAGFGGSEKSADDDDDAEDKPISVPEEVSGSYLTMDCDWLSDYNENKQFQTIGCNAYDDNQQRYSSDHEFALALYHDDKPIAMNTTVSKSPDWDIYGDFPTEYFHLAGTELRIKVQKDETAVMVRSMPCSDIGKSMAENTAAAIKGGVALTYFEAHTKWEQPLEYDGDLVPSFFCNADGPRGKLPDEVAVSAILSEPLVGVSVSQIEVEDMQFRSGEKYCFEKFDMGTDKYVHAIATAVDSNKGCYAIKVDGVNRFIGVLRNDQAVANSLSVDALEDFIAANLDTDCED